MVHAVEVGDARGDGLAADLLEPALDLVDVGAPRLEDDVHVVAVTPPARQADRGVVQARRPLAAAVDQQHGDVVGRARTTGAPRHGGRRGRSRRARGRAACRRCGWSTRAREGAWPEGVMSNAVATLCVSRAATRLARPATAPDSWINDGTRASRAPAINGMLAYPPMPTATSLARAAGCGGPATRRGATYAGNRKRRGTDVAGEGDHVDEVERVPGLGDQAALEAAPRADERDARVGRQPLERARQRQARVDVTTRAPGGDHDRRVESSGTDARHDVPK